MAIALRRRELLREFWTTISWNPESLFVPLVPKAIRKELERRAFPSEVRGHTHTTPLLELGRLAAQRLKLNHLTRHETGLVCVDKIYRSFDETVATRLRATRIGYFQAAYAYEDGALQTFRAAAQQGVRRIYDLPAGYWRARRDFFREEALSRPEWASTLTINADSDEKLGRKDDELSLADAVIVPSNFSFRTLDTWRGGALPRVFVTKFGAPAPIADIRPTSRRGPLRVLFVGAMAAHKGLAYLFEAMSMVGSAVELTLVGRKGAETCAPRDQGLARYRWIPSMPNQQLLDFYSKFDVFVFPSLFEGMALVQLEALSRGLALIATPNTGAEDLITHGREGFIVPIRSPEALANRLTQLHDDRDLLDSMRHAAIARAKSLTWERYHESIAAAVRPLDN